MSEPIRASEEPFIIEVETGKSYYWCACRKKQEIAFL